MRANFLYASVIVCFVLVSILLLLEEEKELVIITSPTIISRYHSDQLETITIDVLTNTPEHYYFDSDTISQTIIQNNEELVSLELVDIQIDTSPILYEGNAFYLVSYSLRMQMDSPHLLLSIPDAEFIIRYDDGTSTNLLIGEFNYQFLQTEYHDIALHNLSATHEEVNGYNTVGGINLSLSNQTSSNITITSIDLLSSSVQFNTYLAREREACDYQMSVANCLSLEHYAFDVHNDFETSSILIPSHNTVDLYVPLTYVNAPYIHRFGIIVTYLIHEETRYLVIDDFPFLRTSLFQLEYEELYHVHTIPHN